MLEETPDAGSEWWQSHRQIVLLDHGGEAREEAGSAEAPWATLALFELRTTRQSARWAAWRFQQLSAGTTPPTDDRTENFQKSSPVTRAMKPKESRHRYIHHRLIQWKRTYMVPPETKDVVIPPARQGWIGMLQNIRSFVSKDCDLFMVCTLLC